MLKNAIKLKYTDDALELYVREVCDVTVRYEDEKGISAGDIIMMQTTDKEVVGSAFVDFVAECKLTDVLPLIEFIGGMYPVDDEETLLQNMNYFYDEVNRYDYLKVIHQGHIRLEPDIEEKIGLKESSE